MLTLTFLVLSAAPIDVHGTITLGGGSAATLCHGAEAAEVHFTRHDVDAVLPATCGDAVRFTGPLTPGVYAVTLQVPRRSDSPTIEPITERVEVKGPRLTLAARRFTVAGRLAFAGAAHELFVARRKLERPSLAFIDAAKARRFAELREDGAGARFEIFLPKGTYDVVFVSAFAPYDAVLRRGLAVKADASPDFTLAARKVHFTLKVNGAPPRTTLTRGDESEGDVLLAGPGGLEIQHGLGPTYDFIAVLPDGVWQPRATVHPAVARPPPADEADLDLRSPRNGLYWPWLERVPAAPVTISRDGDVVIDLRLEQLAGTVDFPRCAARKPLVTYTGKDGVSLEAVTSCDGGHLTYDAVAPPGAYRVVVSFEEQGTASELVLETAKRTATLR